MSLRLSLCSVLALVPSLAAQGNEVLWTQKISSTWGQFPGPLADGDRFGSAICSLGDLDGDGVVDLAVGAPGDDGGGTERGAVWILFLRTPGGPVKSAVKIDETIGGFTGGLVDHAAFGTSVSLVGDFSGDGLPELAVGAPATDAVGTFGRVYLLSLTPGGGIAALTSLASGENGIPASLVEEPDPFGESVAGIGDLDVDGIPDLAIGRKIKNGFGYLLVARMRADGTARNVLRVGMNEGGFDPSPDFVGGLFGTTLTPLGDLDRDGVLDLLVGEGEYDGPFPGAYWVLFLEPLGSVVEEVNVTGYDPLLGGCCGIGTGMAPIGDVNGDGVVDLALGAPARGYYVGDPHVPTNFRPQTGAAMIVLLNADGTPAGSTEIDADSGNLTATLDIYDHFGRGVAPLGDFVFGGDGISDVVVGAPDDDDGGTDRGALYVLSLDGFAYPSSANVYNGSHENDLCFANASQPALGSTWATTVDASTHPGATATGFMLSLDSLPPGVHVLGGQELLARLGPFLLGSTFQAASGSVDTFLSPIPSSPALFGIETTAQGLILGGGIELCNALELLVQN